MYTQDLISDISIEAGYSSLQSFSKAFFKQFKVSPTIARKNKNAVFETFINTEFSKIKIEKVYKNALIIHYLFTKTNNYNNQQINSIWREIEMKNILIPKYESFGIIKDQPLITNPKDCVFEFAVDHLDQNNKGFSKKEIFGQYYLKFTHCGSHDLIENTYKLFYRFWLNSNYQLGDSPVIEHYIISERQNAQPKDFVTDIYFPLK